MTIVPTKLTCRVCGNAPSRTFSTNGYSYAVCHSCGSINKILTADEYRSLLVTYDPGEFIDGINTEELRTLLTVDAKKRRLRPTIARLRSRRKEAAPLRLLDIGCGLGGYLLAAKELGLEVKGIEPSASHSHVGRIHFGLDIANEYFSKDTARNELYDVIVLSHVIEYIFDQQAFLEEIYSRLSPGGVILLATPNASSTIARLTGRYWSMLQPIDHVGLLTARSLAMLAPQGSLTNIWTDEFLWEPFVALATGFRCMIQSRLKCRDGQSAPPVQTPPKSVVSNSFRSSSTRMKQNNVLRIVATVLSLPLFLFDKQFLMGACLFCEIQRPV
jgi:SAM-dependent methyltransferase